MHQLMTVLPSFLYDIDRPDLDFFSIILTVNLSCNVCTGLSSVIDSFIDHFLRFSDSFFTEISNMTTKKFSGNIRCSIWNTFTCNDFA